MSVAVQELISTKVQPGTLISDDLMMQQEIRMNVSSGKITGTKLDNLQKSLNTELKLLQYELDALIEELHSISRSLNPLRKNLPRSA